MQAMLEKIMGLFRSKEVETLEQFIIRHEPKDLFMVEHLEREYDRVMAQRGPFPVVRA
jgi:hypothetical protein